MEFENMKSEMNTDQEVPYRLGLVCDPRNAFAILFQSIAPAENAFLLPDKYKELRQKSGLGASQVAQALELTRAEYKRVENGKMPVDLIQLVFLTALYSAPGTNRSERQGIIPRVSMTRSLKELDVFDLDAVANYNLMNLITIDHMSAQKKEVLMNLIYSMTEQADKERKKYNIISPMEFADLVRESYHTDGEKITRICNEHMAGCTRWVKENAARILEQEKQSSQIVEESLKRLLSKRSGQDVSAADREILGEILNQVTDSKEKQDLNLG